MDALWIMIAVVAGFLLAWMWATRCFRAGIEVGNNTGAKNAVYTTLYVVYKAIEEVDRPDEVKESCKEAIEHVLRDPYFADKYAPAALTYLMKSEA